AARAIAQLPGPESLLILRLKALVGDEDAEVIGQCLVSLLDISPSDYLDFVARFLDAEGDVRMEAAAALGECHEPRAVDLLIEAWKKHREPGILLTLGAGRHTPAAEFLLSVVTDGRLDEAATAIQALAAGRFRVDFRARVESAVAARND